MSPLTRDPTDYRCYHVSDHHGRVPIDQRGRWEIELLATDGSSLEWWPGASDIHANWRTPVVDSLTGWWVVGWRERGGPGNWPSIDGSDQANWPKYRKALMGHAQRGPHDFTLHGAPTRR